jgi:NAD(P)-dependent dehydrogenase (short-subunit alcohol dehydrogenase family)
MSSPKVWLITGASRGFGRRWTEAALARGDKVAATARDLKSLENLQQQYGDALLPLALDHRAGAIRDGFHERIVYQTGDANAGLRVRTAAPGIVADRGGLRRSFRNRRSDSEGGRCVRPASSSYPRQCDAAVDQTGLRGAPEDLGKLGQCLEGRARQQAGITS